jgi:hypothetical protein
MPNSQWGDTGSDCAVGGQYPQIAIFLFRQRAGAGPIALHREAQMYPKNVFVGILAAGFFVAASVVAPNVGHAQAVDGELEVHDCEIGSAKARWK